MKTQLNILGIVSTRDFANFTRRATLEALSGEVDNLDILFYTGIKNIHKKKQSIPSIRSRKYHFWVPDKFKHWNSLSFLEHNLRKIKWKSLFKQYNVIFFNDPNQAWLLPYTNKNQKLVYLIRDPNILQNPAIKPFEKQLIEKVDLVLATSYNLTHHYIPKYYGMEPDHVHFWPNSVDLNVWDINKVEKRTPDKPVVGVAGNFGKNRTDYDLLDYITDKRPDYRFEIAGKINPENNPEFWEKLLKKKNVTYFGFIPQEQLPQTVASWNVGLITDKINEYTSYMHHNKVYQYLAMGVPVVSLRIHEDYKDLYPNVQLADNHESYLEEIDRLAEKSYNQIFQNECTEIALKKTSQERVKKFISIVKS